MLDATVLAAIGPLTGRRMLRRRLLSAAAPLLGLAVLTSMSIGVLLLPAASPLRSPRAGRGDLGPRG
jgi:hypothetical protein